MRVIIIMILMITIIVVITISMIREGGGWGNAAEDSGEKRNKGAHACHEHQITT